jgi:hypothetical protein
MYSCFSNQRCRIEYFVYLVHRINRLKFGIQKQNDLFIHQVNIPIKYGVLDLTIRVHNLYQCHKIKVL